jgi:hypothetical protein
MRWAAPVVEQESHLDDRVLAVLFRRAVSSQFILPVDLEVVIGHVVIHEIGVAPIKLRDLLVEVL